MMSVVLESKGKGGVGMWPRVRVSRVIWGRQSICPDVLPVGDVEWSVLIA